MEKKHGRPPLAPAQRRTVLLKVMVTPREKARVVRLARETGLDLSEVMRQALTLVYAEAQQ